MGFMDLVTKRRSVRSYTSTNIPREMLLDCVEAARLAPSACNVQPWRFVVVDDRELVKSIARDTCHSIYAMNKFIGGAAALVVAVSDKETFIRTLGSRIKGTDYYLIDMGISCEHLILRAAELGIGSCWIGWFDERKMKETLHIPGNKRVDIVISLGYPQAVEQVRKTRKTRSEIVSFNMYER